MRKEILMFIIFAFWDYSIWFVKHTPNGSWFNDILPFWGMYLNIWLPVWFVRIIYKIFTEDKKDDFWKFFVKSLIIGVVLTITFQFLFFYGMATYIIPTFLFWL